MRRQFVYTDLIEDVRTHSRTFGPAFAKNYKADRTNLDPDFLPLWRVNKTRREVSVPDARIGAHSHSYIVSPDAAFRSPTLGVNSRQQLPERLVLKPDPAPRHYI